MRSTRMRNQDLLPALPSRILLLVILPILLCASPGPAFSAGSEIRGIWMHASRIKSRAEAGKWVARIDEANLNTVILLAWYWGGQACYRSELSPMRDGIEEGFDPQGYMIEECHKRGIEVHARFVNGSYGAGAYGTSKAGYLLVKHPDWAVDAGPGCELWYDFGKPEVRKFQSDLMIECLKNYDLDGIQFDFIRYGPRACWCKHCQEEFARKYRFEPTSAADRLRFPTLVSVRSNPVAGPTTAKVLARFSDGLPAIAVNELGKGMVLLLNWHAEENSSEAVVETVKRALREWGVAGKNVFVMDTEENRARYGGKYPASAARWFLALGCRAETIGEDRLPGLPQGSLLVLSGVYLIPPEVAKQIERFVEQGGKLIVIDGPVLSIRDKSVQRLLGMRDTGQYFGRVEIIQAAGQSNLVPSSGRKIDPEQVKLRAQKWAEFRAWGVTELVRDVYRRAKAVKPQAQVTACVFTPLERAESVYQDWPGWLREGIIDYVIPMAYTVSNDKLKEQIEEWKTVDATLDRIVPGLGIFQPGSGTPTSTDDGLLTRDIDLIFSQHQLCIDNGARGSVWYCDFHLSQPLITAFRTGPYKTKVQPGRPRARSDPR